MPHWIRDTQRGMTQRRVAIMAICLDRRLRLGKIEPEPVHLMPG